MAKWMPLADKEMVMKDNMVVDEDLKVIYTEEGANFIRVHESCRECKEKLQV
jgi:hypothetical protein